MELVAMNFENQRLFTIDLPGDLSAQGLVIALRSMAHQTVMQEISSPPHNTGNGPKDPRRVRSVIIDEEFVITLHTQIF